jgi:hypothetical protein
VPPPDSLIAAYDKNSSPGELYPAARTWATGNLSLERAVTFFDTSAISLNDTIASATVSLYAVSVLDQDNDGDDYIGLVQAKNGWASATTVAAGDYDQIGDAIDNPTQGATAIDLTDMHASSYNYWTLNATGRSWIARSGETKPSASSHPASPPLASERDTISRTRGRSIAIPPTLCLQVRWTSPARHRIPR